MKKIYETNNAWFKKCDNRQQFQLANQMDAKFQNDVKAQFEKDIQEELSQCPLFPELLPDIFFYWQSAQTRRVYKLARHSFKTGKTTYRFFDELKKLQQEEKKRTELKTTLTEIQLMRCQQLAYAQKIGFNIEWADYHRFCLL